MARPLLQRNGEGVLSRPPGIETKIDAALGQDWATLSKRAREIHPRSANFLPSECLVHLIRHALRRGDDRTARVLMPQLLNRAEANLLRTVPETRMRDAESVRQDILSSLMQMFMDDGTEDHEDELDFYECKFNRALRLLRIDHVRSALSKRKHLTDLPEASNEEGEPVAEDEMLTRLSRKANRAAIEHLGLQLTWLAPGDPVLKGARAVFDDQSGTIFAEDVGDPTAISGKADTAGLNKRSSTPNGKLRPLGISTLRDRVCMTAAMLVLDPIFEADLPPEQYAYRIGRNAQQAVVEVEELLFRGHPEVVDADLADYFGSIPHAELLKSVARRVVDRRVLHLIKQWLECPVEETDDRGRKTHTTEAKDHRRGIPQGSPISPLLANLYMRRFVLGWKKLGLEKSLGSRIVTYADDLVILCRKGKAAEALQRLREIMGRLKLTVNEEKTRICKVPERQFDFLGTRLGGCIHRGPASRIWATGLLRRASSAWSRRFMR
jgi:hypothetical protein